MKFKIWAHVEAINEDAGHYLDLVDAGLIDPVPLGEFSSLAEAWKHVMELPGYQPHESDERFLRIARRIERQLPKIMADPSSAPGTIRPLGAMERTTILAALRFWQQALATNEAQTIMPEHFADTEPLSTAAIDGLCERLNLAVAGFTIAPDTVDWVLLHKQKETLVRLLAEPSAPLDEKTREDLAGILHLIDGVQDYGAEQLGEENVYGSA